MQMQPTRLLISRVKRDCVQIWHSKGTLALLQLSQLSLAITSAPARQALKALIRVASERQRQLTCCSTISLTTRIRCGCEENHKLQIWLYPDTETGCGSEIRQTRVRCRR